MPTNADAQSVTAASAAAGAAKLREAAGATMASVVVINGETTPGRDL
jgi:hypothetical protein